MSLRKLAAAAILGLAACTAAACDSQNSPAPGAGSPGQTPVPAAASPGATAGAGGHGATDSQCAAASSAVVGKALNLPVGKVVTSVEGPVTVCAYSGKYEVIVRYQVGESASQFARDRSSIAHLHQSVSGVGGVGNEAYFARYVAAGPASNTLAARKGAVAVFITSPAQLSAERTLMTDLLAKI
jgi:hypothetical protein